MQLLTAYHWPGNFREVQMLCECAVMLAPGPVLDASFVREHLIRLLASAAGQPDAPVLVVVDQMENELRAARGGQQPAVGGAAFGHQPVYAMAKDEKIRVDVKRHRRKARKWLASVFSTSELEPI